MTFLVAYLSLQLAARVPVKPISIQLSGALIVV